MTGSLLLSFRRKPKAGGRLRCGLLPQETTLVHAHQLYANIFHPARATSLLLRLGSRCGRIHHFRHWHEYTDGVLAPISAYPGGIWLGPWSDCCRLFRWIHRSYIVLPVSRHADGPLWPAAGHSVQCGPDEHRHGFGNTDLTAVAPPPYTWRISRRGYTCPQLHGPFAVSSALVRSSTR